MAAKEHTKKKNIKKWHEKELLQKLLYFQKGWGSAFGTTKCIMTDILKFQKFLFVYFYFIYIFDFYLFQLFEHWKYMIIFHIGNFWKIL